MNRSHQFLPKAILPFAFLCAMALAIPANAGEIHFTLNNDFLTTNPIDDDLYTSGVRLGYAFADHDVRVVENTFTDSKNDLRFDETYLSFGRVLTPWRGWHPQVRFGALRVGRGLLGEAFQNSVHDAIGDDPVNLTYLDRTYLYPTVGFELRREFVLSSSVTIVPRAKIESSVGFKSGLEVSAAVTWTPPAIVWFGVEAGVRYTETDFFALKPWIQESGALWELSVGLPGQLVWSWNYNQFGTRLQHITLVYRWKSARERAAAKQEG